MTRDEYRREAIRWLGYHMLWAWSGVTVGMLYLTLTGGLTVLSFMHFCIQTIVMTVLLFITLPFVLILSPLLITSFNSLFLLSIAVMVSYWVLGRQYRQRHIKTRIDKSSTKQTLAQQNSQLTEVANVSHVVIGLYASFWAWHFYALMSV